jgi:hypothetical protein
MGHAAEYMHAEPLVRAEAAKVQKVDRCSHSRVVPGFHATYLNQTWIMAAYYQPPFLQKNCVPANP